MNPALSIVFFTVLAGTAQGLVVALSVATLVGNTPGRPYMAQGLALALVLLLIALGSSFLHLGHKLRAWRAVLMWRTSWMSREVLVLPAFIATVAAWWLSVEAGAGAGASRVLALLALLLAALLWYCTAMIYACLRFVQEWAHPLTITNFVLIGMASGLAVAGALGVVAGAAEFARDMAPWALAGTLAAWFTRVMSLRRNAGLRPRSTVQSATGIRAAKVTQISMGMTAGSFNTREFFHRASRYALPRIKLGFLCFGFAIPALLLSWSLLGGDGIQLLIAAPLQMAGLLAERWFFFAEARHPQNLYYQVVS